jgi:hypothetical protein
MLQSQPLDLPTRVRELRSPGEALPASGAVFVSSVSTPVREDSVANVEAPDKHLDDLIVGKEQQEGK